MSATSGHTSLSRSLSHRLKQMVSAGSQSPSAVRSSQQQLRRTFLFHFRPATVSADTVKFTLSWGLGGMAAVLVGIQLISGILLKLVYEPSPLAAYPSVKSLTDHILFGDLIRNIHHWAANLLVLMVGLHLLRVFFTSAVHGRRRLNWIVGLVQFGLILAANFTGYLLPWDQLAYWAVTICTKMLDYLPVLGPWLLTLITDGGEVGPATLRLFYALHTAIIPAFLLIAMAFHFWRVRKAGGLVRSNNYQTDSSAKPPRLPLWPHLLTRELTVSSVLIAVVLMMALMMNAPLGPPANPGLSPNPTKAPWYFAGFQELLLHVPPICAVLVIPGATLLGLGLVPFFKNDSPQEGIWFISPKGRRLASGAALLSLVLTPGWILLDEFVFSTGDPAAGAAHGWGGFGILVAGIAGVYLAIGRALGATPAETRQAVFVILTVGFGVLTLTNLWFRGVSMALAWPW